MSEVSNKRILLLGWDGADWKIIEQLLEKGRMPALEILIRQGVKGNISILMPILSPLLWSTIATGRSVDKHKQEKGQVYVCLYLLVLIRRY